MQKKKKCDQFIAHWKLKLRIYWNCKCLITWKFSFIDVHVALTILNGYMYILNGSVRKMNACITGKRQYAVAFDGNSDTLQLIHVGCSHTIAWHGRHKSDATLNNVLKHEAWGL